MAGVRLEDSCRYKIVEQFVADGIGYVFGNPGTVEEGLLDALSSFPDLTYVLALQEGVAVGAADGYARSTRRVAVVQLHSSVGLANGTSLLYQAKRGHSPLLVVAGEAGVAFDAMEAQNSANLVDIVRPFVKYAARVVHPSSVLRVVRRALRIAATPPMGPTFVALPQDVLDSRCDEEVVPTPVPRTRVAPADADILEAADILLSAERPLCIVGDGVAFSSAQPELERLATILGAQIVGADSSEVNVRADHPLFRGLLGHMFGEDSRAITSNADVVLVCGTYLFPEVFPSISGAFARGAKLVCIDLDVGEMGKNFPFSIGLLADPKLTLAKLGDAVDGRASAAFRSAAQSRAEAAAKEFTRTRAMAIEADRVDRDATRIRMARFAEELAVRLPADAIVFDEALTSSPDLCRHLLPRAPGSYFQTRGGSLGVGFPGAIGAKLAHPTRQVVGFSGDGGAMYTIQSLWTAAHHRVGAKFVVCNNRSYRILKLNIDRYWQERAPGGTALRPYPSGFDLRDPEIQFDQLAESLGVAALRIEESSAIGPAIDRMLANPEEPFLIDLVLGDPME